ncbi:GNAT family N-acetyltransferase [Bacillus sp. J33]|uniref:GNAT family N-acetyltransferase n=1 Tax=Bacillus sp. J33 TaxID=935836 RepID=UPI00047C7963|nr:GNAT family N-acetyltransferase [Bacillus sp. J33]
MSEEIPEKHLFMMCTSLNLKAIRELPKGYHFRLCRKDELDIWKAMHFDTSELAREYHGFMTEYFNQVYLPKGNLFFKSCLFACNEDDKPIGTCFLWKSYNQIWTIQWFKVVKEYEGKGIGRALLSHVMRSLPHEEYPVFLHTHPSGYRAIKLYSDVGFKLLTDPVIGNRKNELEESLSILEKYMPKLDFEKLQFNQAPTSFLTAVSSSNIDEF